MQPRLKENPRDWLKFTAGVSLLLMLAILTLRRRGVISSPVMWIGLAFPSGAFLLCLFKPRLFRQFYRVGMTISFYIGQFVGRILLMALFLLAVTPLGLFLRLIGKDLLSLKRNGSAESYWEPVKQKHELEREF